MTDWLPLVPRPEQRRKARIVQFEPRPAPRPYRPELWRLDPNSLAAERLRELQRRLRAHLDQEQGHGRMGVDREDR